MQGAQAAGDLRHVLEELDRLVDRHLQHVGDGLALEADLERLAVVALAVALLAGHVDVGQEVHLDLDLAVALAGLAAAALDVEAEAAGLVAARSRLLGLGEELADVVEDAGVGGRVGARRAADRRLVDVDDLVDLVEAVDPVVGAGRSFAWCRRLATAWCRVSLTRVDLPEPETPVTQQKTPSGNRDVDVLEVVLAGAADRQRRRVGRRRCAGTSMRFLPERYWPVSEAGFFVDLGGRAVRRSRGRRVRRRPGRGRPGGRRRIIVPSSCSTTITVLPRSRRRSQRRDQLLVVALVEADRRLVEHVHDADQAASRSGSRGGSAAPRRRRACGPSGRA